jgi:hypothetical protein
MILYFLFTSILLLNVLIGKTWVQSVALDPSIPQLTLELSHLVHANVALVNAGFNDGDVTWELEWRNIRLQYIEIAEMIACNSPGNILQRMSRGFFKHHHMWI